MTSKLEISFAALDKKTDRILAAVSHADSVMPPALTALDDMSGGQVKRAAGIAKFTGSKKSVLDIVAPGGLELDRLTVFGLGKSDKYTEEDWLSLGGRVAAQLADAKAVTADLLLELDGDETVSAREAGLAGLGALLRSYEFRKYKKKKKKKEGEDDEENEASTLTSLTILCADPEAAGTEFEALRAVGDGVFLARDLVNEPANILSPEEFANRAASLSEFGVNVEILDQAKLEELGMTALLAVGQGSERPSYVAVMRWNGAQDPSAPPIALIGKGVCFDTGGISIKPAVGMEEMKGDMGGAAAVAGAMMALAKRKAKLNVVGMIGLTENMPSGTAQRPGDIIESLSGQTIEVINTDAEGRLVLADIMWYAQEQFEPKAMITLATLTGAVIVALGKEHAGLYANDDELAERLTEAGIETADKVWRMPLGPKYDKLLNSKFADMKNIGGRNAGSITAAQFLQRFVKSGSVWAHLDVAGTAMAAPSTDFNKSWGSGYGVMLLDRLASKYYEE